MCDKRGDCWLARAQLLSYRQSFIATAAAVAAEVALFFSPPPPLVAVHVTHGSTDEYRAAFDDVSL